MRLILILLSHSIACSAQHVIIGAEGGLRTTGDTPAYGSSNSKRYLVGPKIEVGLPLQFALEADVLYSRLGNTMYIPLVGEASTIRTIADSWAFPVLVKYHLPVARVHPFLSAGVAPRRASGRINTIQYGFYPGDVAFASTAWHAHDHAWVLGGGTELRSGRIRITPELRYLRSRGGFSPFSSNVAHYLNVPQNEVQVLIGIGWSVR